MRRLISVCPIADLQPGDTFRQLWPCNGHINIVVPKTDPHDERHIYYRHLDETVLWRTDSRNHVQPCPNPQPTKPSPPQPNKT